ncbi:MAG TPA: RNA polymerase sigma factor [Holophagaceae bacterium]|nr:RNA polymerase sigma factor [Holophagaceae bacterium]
MTVSMPSDLPLDLASAAPAPAAATGAPEALLANLRERMVAFAASRYAGLHAEDLAQETLVVIHEKYAHLSRVEDLLPVCFQILRFKLVALQRKQGRRGEYDAASVEDLPLAGDAPDPEAAYARTQMLDRLGRALKQLGERCRELFRLKLQGRSFPEIRELMGAEALNTVYTWDHRCRKQLLEHMGGRWEA